MQDKDYKCGHNCRNTCGMLNEALRRETASIRFFETVYDECSAPQVKTFINELIESRRSDMLKIIQKLNEIHATSQALDGIASSFNAV